MIRHSNDIDNIKIGKRILLKINYEIEFLFLSNLSLNKICFNH